MVSTQSLILPLLILRTISACPLPQQRKQAKRSATPPNIGSGFAISICIMLLFGIFYYLGMHHDRMKLWLKKRNAPTESKPACESKPITEGQKHKRQISCPLAVYSSAPIKPYEDPIEAPTPSLRYYELPIKEVHEMGLPSPKKLPPRASWLSLDRKPWWLKYPENEEQRQSARMSRARSMRSWFRSDRSTDITQEKASSLAPNVNVTRAVQVEARHAHEDEKERKSDGSSLMDWSGLDYVRRIYIERKSRVGL